MPGPSFPCRIDKLGLVSSDGSIAAFEASPIPDHLVFVVPFGGVGVSQFAINETCVVGELDAVEVGVHGDSAGLVGGACSGAGLRSGCSDCHANDVGAAVGSVSLDGSGGSGNSSGAMSAPSSGAFSAPLSCPVDRHSKEEGDEVGDGCVPSSSGRLCGAGQVSASSGSSPCGGCGSFNFAARRSSICIPMVANG